MNCGILCAGKGKEKYVTPVPDDDNLANLVAAIAGGIEAPIQFILQVLLSCCNVLLIFMLRITIIGF